jgi:hypothetical protein
MGAAVKLLTLCDGTGRSFDDRYLRAKGATVGQIGAKADEPCKFFFRLPKVATDAGRTRSTPSLFSNKTFRPGIDLGFPSGMFRARARFPQGI